MSQLGTDQNFEPRFVGMTAEVLFLCEIVPPIMSTMCCRINDTVIALLTRYRLRYVAAIESSIEKKRYFSAKEFVWRSAAQQPTKHSNTSKQVCTQCSDVSYLAGSSRRMDERNGAN
jgi:hypothetical protein